MTRRFRAPRGDGERLVVPAFNEVGELARRNRERLDAAKVVIDGTPLPEFRHLARLEITRTDRVVFATGHQPELFHPGVWAKNFALNGLARQLDATPLNLIVDNDTMKSASILTPVWDADPTKVRFDRQPFGEFAGEVPWEFTAWATEFSARRIETEREWGCENLELRVSDLSQSRSFRRFALHISQDLARFREAYNRAVGQYRTTHGIWSQSHPVPDLGEGELPFWDFRGSRRSRATPVTPPEHLRPRALTLTLFVRLCLADWFIHGIGGGKYDEVTDEIIRHYFGLEPPMFQVVTGTLYLPRPAFPALSDDLVILAHQLRQLHWNPEQFLPADHPARGEKLRLVSNKPQERDAIHAWYCRIRELTETLRIAVKPQVNETEGRLTRVRAELDANAILRRRDYAWVLYPEEVLKPFLQGFLKS